MSMAGKGTGQAQDFCPKVLLSTVLCSSEDVLLFSYFYEIARLECSVALVFGLSGINCDACL